MWFRWTDGLVLLVLVTALVACGKASTQSASLSTGASDLTQAVDCSAGAPQLALTAAASPQLRHVPAQSLVFHATGQDTSLCDLLKDSGKTLMVLQFVGVRCYSCLKWADTVAAQLKTADPTSVLVAVTTIDDEQDLTDAQMTALQQSVAPTAIWGRDASRALWDFFAPDLTAVDPQAPLAIVMDLGARGYLSQDTTQSGTALVSQAQALLKSADSGS